MAEIRVVSIKGRIRELGPRLEHAPHVIYVGRRMTMGGWDLPCSPFHNPYPVKSAGSAERAAELFSAYLTFNPWLVEQAAVEIARRGPDACFGCWCDVDSGAPCHGRVLAERVTALAEPIPPPTTESHAVHAACGVLLRSRETVRVAGNWAGAL